MSDISDKKLAKCKNTFKFIVHIFWPSQDSIRNLKATCALQDNV